MVVRVDRDCVYFGWGCETSRRKLALIEGVYENRYDSGARIGVLVDRICHRCETEEKTPGTKESASLHLQACHLPRCVTITSIYEQVYARI